MKNKKTDELEFNLFRAVGKQHPLEVYIQQARAIIESKHENAVVIFDDGVLGFAPSLLGKKVDASWGVGQGAEQIEPTAINPMDECYDDEDVITGTRKDMLVDDYADWVGHFTVDFMSETLHIFGLVFGGDYTACKHVYGIAGHSERILSLFLKDLKTKKNNKIKSFIHEYIFTDDKLGVKRSDLTWDSLVIKDGLRETLESNIDSFFKAKEIYATHKLAYRRGLILTGPPGSGKSTALKILSSKYRNIAFFLHGFTSKGTFEDMRRMEKIFSRASDLSPAVVILEDLDRLANDAVMRSMLNLFDGIDSVSGVLILATSNNPEKIDPALIERPSRFDLVLRFDNPDAELRTKYIKTRFSAALELTESQIFDIVQRTNKYSMAMLQEIFTGSMLEAVNKNHKLGWDDVKVSMDRLANSIKTVKKETGQSSDKGVGFNIKDL